MNVFQLIVVAVVAGILIYIAMGFFQPSEAKALEDLRNGVDYAEQHTGNIQKAEIAYRKGFSLSAANLDSASRNVRLECSSAETCSQEKMVLQPRLMMAKEQALMNTYFRCKNKGLINDCVIYFGEKPAQLEIQNVVFSEPKNGPGTITFEVKNSGELDAVDSVYSVKVYSKEKLDSATKQVLKSEVRGLLNKIVPGQVQGIRHQLELPPAGRYALKIEADGEDAGNQVWEKDFNIAETISSGCAAQEIRAATLSNGVCRTQYTCTGCPSGAECSLRWMEKGISSGEIAETYSTGVYVEKPAVNGSCG